MKKAIEDRQDQYLALLELRNTPLPGGGLSPVQLLMGRRTRSFIPAKSSLYMPNNISGKSVKKKLQFKQQKQKYYDRNAQEKKPLSTGDLVIIRSHQTSSNTWNPGKVVKQCEELRFCTVKSGGRTFRRHNRDLLRTKEKSFPDNSQSREKEDEVVVVPPVKENSKSVTFSEKAQQPVLVSKSENVKVSEKSCESNQNVNVKTPEKKSVNGDAFNSGIRFTRFERASVLPARYQT